MVNRSISPSTVQFRPSQYARGLFGLCYHEASHAVAGVLHGGTLTESRIFLADLRGSTTFEGGSLAATRHGQVAYAGPWGQARALAQRRPGLHDVRAALDGGGCSDRAVLTAAGGESAGDAITPLLERCWPSVAELAVRLHQHGKVSHADVLAALRLSADDQTRALVVSMIRSGAEPGSFTVSGRG